mgnify:CR=1 FL=1
MGAQLRRLDSEASDGAEEFAVDARRGGEDAGVFRETLAVAEVEEFALDIGIFIDYRASWSFVSGLQAFKTKLDKLAKASPEKAKSLAAARAAYEQLMQRFPQHALMPQAVFERALYDWVERINQAVDNPPPGPEEAGPQDVPGQAHARPEGVGGDLDPGHPGCVRAGGRGPEGPCGPVWGWRY